MRWLILSETKEKAAVFRTALPDCISVSTDGMPWVAEIKLGEKLSFSKILRGTSSIKDIIRKIQDAAMDCDIALLAFDPDTVGEACAFEFSKLLKMPTARWVPTSLAPVDIKREVGRLETLSKNQLPTPNQGRTESYWAQRIIDFVWAEKTTEWLESLNREQIKVTRLMAALLKMVAQETDNRISYLPQKYWELRCSMAPKTKADVTRKGQIGYAIVPSLTTLHHSAPKTKEIWKQKIEEAEEQSRKGLGLAQPGIGQNWRFQKAAASTHASHLNRFPFFIIEHIDTEPAMAEKIGPMTYSDIIKKAVKDKRGTPENIERHLMDLYHMGWITHPKSSNPNLKPSTVASLVEYAKTVNISVNPVPNRFGEAPEGDRWAEAIRPTRWALTDQKARDVLPESETKSQKLWVYRMIYQRALESQIDVVEEPVSRLYLLGPLSMRRNTKKVGEFVVDKERRMSAHMNMLLSVPWKGDVPTSDTLFECTAAEFVERSTEGPEPLTEQALIEIMIQEHLGKRKPLKDMVSWLKNNDLIKEVETGEIKLTPKGKSLNDLLSNHFGQFLEKSYHRAITAALSEVESGEISCQSFLDEWWADFQPSIED